MTITRISALALIAALTGLTACDDGANPGDTDARNLPTRDAAVGDAAVGSEGEGEGEGEGDPARWADSWTGTFELFGSFSGGGPGGGGGMEFGCEGSLEVDVDINGTAYGTGDCDFEPFGLVPVELVGDVGPTGDFAGVLLIDARVEMVTADASGVATDDNHIDSDLAAVLVLGGGPASGEEVELTGVLNLAR